MRKEELDEVQNEPFTVEEIIKIRSLFLYLIACVHFNCFSAGNNSIFDKNKY